MEHECTLWLASMNVPLGNFMDVGLISYSPKLDGDYDLLIMVVWYTDIKLITLITYWWLSRWRFGTWTLFFHILRISYSQLTNSIIFQRGGEKPPTSYVISIYNPSFITIYNHFYWYYNHYFYIIPLLMIIYMLLNTMKLVEPLNHQRIPEIRPLRTRQLSRLSRSQLAGNSRDFFCGLGGSPLGL